uniref:RING-type domain-containing protein n=2 Tax=Clytia hemisphaerica TaxID=252671 RepID=A0A7M5U9E5_9CNID
MAFVEGYDVETVQDISSDLFCVICLKLMRNPVQFKCGHGMCFVCFKSLLHRSKQKATTQCPQCREVVKEGQIVSNVMLHRIILSLHVLCGNHDNGCKWTGELDRFDEHFAQCTKHSENAANKKSKKKKKRADQNQQAPQNIQNELLLQITEQLSNLKEYIISPNATKTQDSDPNSTDAAMKPPFWTRFNNKSVTSSCKTKTLALILFTISLLSGMHLLGGGFSDWFMDEDATANQTPGIDHVATYQQVHSELAKMNSLIYAQQNNFFQLHLGSKELQSDLEAQKTATLRLTGLYLKNSLNAAHFTKTSIADDVDDVFSQEMMHRKLGLERTAGFQLVNMKEDAYAR